MRKIMLLSMAILIAIAPAYARSSEAKKLRDAQMVIKQVVSAPDRNIPEDLLDKAECVGVFPGVAKGAFVVGGEYGRGVFTCRHSYGSMGAPAFFTMGGGSVGWQAGGQSSDLVLLVMNRGGVNRLLKDRFTIGGDAAAVAGPVGRRVQAATDAQLHAQILAWSRSRGAFLGASLTGTVIKPDRKANERFYGRRVTARQILVEHDVSVPEAARPFVTTVTRHAR